MRLSESVPCPCCGHVTKLQPAAIARYLTPLQGRLYDIVRRSMPEGIEAQALWERLYTGTNYDGPVKIIHVHVLHVNARLLRWGLRIWAGRGAGRKYRLLVVDTVSSL